MLARPRKTGPVTIYAPLDTEGGRHKVLLGWHHELGCPVACKRYRSLRRADREAAVLMALSHPAIVRCFGTASPGYLLTEVLDGTTLHDGLQQQDRQRMSVSNTMRLGIRIGAALDYTHRRGFVHLDVKPGNIMIAGGHPKLIDFGAARPIAADATEHTVGTALYMAPEMCLRQKVGAPADVFALGVTLFECLAGEQPFKGRSAGTSVSQVTRSPRRLRDIRNAVPRGLCDLVNAMLAREAADRPALPEIMARLNGFITFGPRLWPYGH
jgi:serine/threonine protein kinase